MRDLFFCHRRTPLINPQRGEKSKKAERAISYAVFTAASVWPRGLTGHMERSGGVTSMFTIEKKEMCLVVQFMSCAQFLPRPSGKS